MDFKPDVLKKDSNLPTFMDEVIEVDEEKKNRDDLEIENGLRSYDPNDITTMVWLGSQEMEVIMELLALPSYLEKPKGLFEGELSKPAKFDLYF